MNINVFGQTNEKYFTVQTSPYNFLLSLIFLDGLIDGSAYPIYLDIEGQYKINNMFNISLTTSFNKIFNGDPIPYFDHAFFLNLKPMFIYRPMKTGFEKYYIGTYLAIGINSSQGIADTGFGISTGYKWIFKNGLTLQTGGGIGRTWFFHFNDHDIIPLYLTDGRIAWRYLDIHFDFKLGYSF
jgi:hypothetical protein